MKRLPRDHIRPPVETGAWRAPSGRFFVTTRGDLTTLPSPASTRRRHPSRHPRQHGNRRPAGRSLALANAFRVTAADGTTELIGALWRPSEFDPAKKYPVIDYIYPVPNAASYPP